MKFNKETSVSEKRKCETDGFHSSSLCLSLTSVTRNHWLSNHTNCFMVDVTTQLCLQFKGSLILLPLKLGLMLIIVPTPMLVTLTACLYVLYTVLFQQNVKIIDEWYSIWLYFQLHVRIAGWVQCFVSTWCFWASWNRAPQVFSTTLSGSLNVWTPTFYFSCCFLQLFK